MSPLNPKDVALNWANARACAEVCALVYNPPCSLPGGAAANPAHDGDIWIEDARTDAHALVQDRRQGAGASQDCIVVCFRGSKDAEDYIQDEKFEMEDLVFSDGELPARVHKGFLEDFDALIVQIIAAVKGIVARGRAPDTRGACAPPRGACVPPIFITGHSLGAALATLCALEFARQKFPIAGIYTFGSPRVGNAAFCKIYDDQLKDITFRVIDENDIVPRVPPLLNGYRHVGNCIFLFCGGGFGINPSLLRRGWSNCLGFWNAFRSVHDVLVTDHHIGSYQTNLSKLP